VFSGREAIQPAIQWQWKSAPSEDCAVNPGSAGDETDPRFPSGRWVGFFVQKHPPVGKQWMELRLTFRSGTVTGEGRDLVGRFLVDGNYDLSNGHCRWTKTYLGRHDVHYAGFNEGKGIWGGWEIPVGAASTVRLHGGFHIWPEGMSDPSGDTLAAEADLPLEQVVETRPVAEPVTGRALARPAAHFRVARP
jgi:hypothetical protein